MSKHFFYVSKNKNEFAFKFLVILNIISTILIIPQLYTLMRKDFMLEKRHILEEYLGISRNNEPTYIYDFNTFNDFFVKSVTVG